MDKQKVLLERLYRSLYRIRRVEEEIVRVYPTDVIKSPVHLSIGQEAVSVGACEALGNDDVVFGTYRGHALYLAKGGDLTAMIAELFGKSTGCARGRGGSMHLVDARRGVMGTSAVVGTTIPHAVGYAYAIRMRGEKRLVASFFGEGATEEGVFHESLNFAALHKLPVIFICENNRYAIMTHQNQRQVLDNICDRARTFGMQAERIEGNDVLAIHEKVGAAVERIRGTDNGPAFFECMTYRWKEHVGPGDDFSLGYRTQQEAEPWIQNDQVRVVGERLEGASRSSIEESVNREIQAAFEEAAQAPFPMPDELLAHVYK